ncbi:hypothetical protein GCM10029978_066950 [Actinoallomurus acanthiterrae]
MTESHYRPEEERDDEGYSIPAEEARASAPYNRYSSVDAVVDAPGDPLARLFNAAHHHEAMNIRSAAVRAGLLWLCECNWYNPSTMTACEQCHQPITAAVLGGLRAKNARYEEFTQTAGGILGERPGDPREEDDEVDSRRYCRFCHRDAGPHAHKVSAAEPGTNPWCCPGCWDPRLG